MAKKQENFIKLRVVEALQDDAYKGIVRIDRDLMQKLELLNLKLLIILL